MRSYQYYPSTFLSLPLELRHQVYSYLLIFRTETHLIDTNIFRSNAVRRNQRNLFLTCPQLYHEAFAYYYSQNPFLLSLTTPYYNIADVVARSDVLQRRLAYVQRLTLDMSVSKEDRARVVADGAQNEPVPIRMPPHQQDNWESLVHVLRDMKPEAGGKVLKQLTINVSQKQKRSKLKGTPSLIPLADVEDEFYTTLLAPLKDCVEQIYIVGHRGGADSGR